MTIVQTLAAQRVCIWLLDNDQTSASLYTMASANTGATVSSGASVSSGSHLIKPSEWPRIPIAQFPLAGKLMGSPTSLVIENAPEDSSLPDALVRDLGLESLYAVSLCNKDSAVGFATIEPAEAAEREDLGSIIPFLASMADHARRAKASESRREIGELLVELSEAGTAHDSLEQIFELICKKLVRRLDVSAALIFLAEEARLIPRKACSADPTIRSDRWKDLADIGEPLPVAEAALSAGVAVSTDGAGSDLIGPIWAQAFEAGPVLAVPLLGPIDPLGVFVFELGFRQSLNESELRLASAAAAHLSRLISDFRANQEAGLRLRVATAVSDLLQAGTETTSVSESLDAITRVVKQAAEVGTVVVLTISPASRIEYVSSLGPSNSDGAILARRLIGMPATELAQWETLQRGSRSGFTVTSNSGRNVKSSVASAFGLSTWAETALWVKEEIRAIIVCGDTNTSHNWSAPERNVLCQLALEGALVLAHAELRQAETTRLVEMAHRALHDPLTSLANRELFSDRLERSLARMDRHPERVAVLFVDLDRFKAINDTYGHQIGDELLKQTARRLASCLRPQDTVSRFGGDEFTVLLDEIGGTEDAKRAAVRIIAQLRRPFDIEGKRIRTSGSVGIALSQSNIAPTDLLRMADIAMYSAKQNGRNRWAFYQDGEQFMGHTSPPRAGEPKQMVGLERALVEKELELWLQPVITFGKSEAREWETLLRWNHPTRGFLCAGEFLPQAEQASLLAQIDWWVLREASTTVARWHAAWGENMPSISVNISHAVLQDATTPERVAELMKSRGSPFNSLILEISEELLSDGDGATWQTAAKLKHMGIKQCLDHLGATSTSLSMLAEQQFYQLKIDRNMIDSNRHDLGLRSLKAAQALASAVGSPLCAVGIETAQQADAVKSVGLTLGQGNLLGMAKPMALVEAKLGASLGRFPPPL